MLMLCHVIVLRRIVLLFLLLLVSKLESTNKSIHPPERNPLTILPMKPKTAWE
jgi:hypothetical protein